MLSRMSASTSEPEAGAQCVSSARWDLSGGRPVRVVPTATSASPRAGRTDPSGPKLALGRAAGGLRAGESQPGPGSFLGV